MKARSRKWLIRTGWVLALSMAAVFAWLKFGAEDEDTALASGNGRIEAVEIDIAAKSPGRVKEIYVREGDFVTAGQVVARMDTDVLEAQLRQAEAQLRQAESSVMTARSQLYWSCFCRQRSESGCQRSPSTSSAAAAALATSSRVP